MKNKLYLIGGAPTTGKSTLAKYLSNKLNIPWISCDQIRSLAQELLKNHKGDNPELFNDAETAEEFYSKNNAKEVAELEIRQSIAFQPILQTFIDRSYPWKSFIVEGVNILPEYISKIRFDGDIIPIFLIDEDEDRAKKVIFERGLWGPAKSYSDELKHIEVEWVKKFSEHIKENCVRHNLKLFEVSKDDESLDKIFNEIYEK
jgi:2-phosphoglycerate kinase